MITYKNVMGHYEIYVNNEFKCSCDSGELTETIHEVEKELDAQCLHINQQML